MRSLLKKNKRGDLTGILFLIVSISAFAFVLLIGGYIATTVSDELQDKINSDTPEVNESFETTRNVAEGTLSALWYIMFAGLILSLIVTAWYMPTNPILIPIFIILLASAVIIGVAMSNVYEELYGVDQLSDIADTQGSINFIMSNLPYVALVIGVIGVIVTFAKPGGQTPIA